MVSRKQITALLLAGLLAAPTAFLPAQDDEIVDPEQVELEEGDYEEITEAPLETVSDSADGEAPSELPEENVEFTLEDLNRMAVLPPGVGKESQEDPNRPVNIFQDEARVRQMLGVDPQFIYYPVGVDPMIIPWVRDEVVAKEKWDEQVLAQRNKDWDTALAILDELRDKYGATEIAPRVNEERRKVVAARDKPEGPVKRTDDEVGKPPIPPPETLPQWIARNTTGVIMADAPVVLLGDEALFVGDVVPGYPGVRVKSIAPQEVVYLYQGKDYKVDVKGTF